MNQRTFLSFVVITLNFAISNRININNDVNINQKQKNFEEDDSRKKPKTN